MNNLDWIANLGGVAYDAGKDIYLFGKRKHDHVKKLDQRFRNLWEEVCLLCSQIRNGECMVQRYEITGEPNRAKFCKVLLNVAEIRIRQFEDLKQRYKNVPRKVDDRHTNGDVGLELDSLQRNYDGHSEVIPRGRSDYVIGSPLFYKLAKLSKDILELTTDVHKLRGEIPRELMAWMEPEQVVKMEDVERIDNVACLNDILEEIMRNLRCDGVRRICIWGATGVGKTSILKNLNNKMEGNSMFVVVIWTSFGDENSVGAKVQRDLIGRLKLNVAKTSSREQNAATISRVLGMKKYLVILDGVCSNINLGELGISKEHRDGKVLFASRCRSVMEADHEIEVKICLGDS